MPYPRGAWRGHRCRLRQGWLARSGSGAQSLAGPTFFSYPPADHELRQWPKGHWNGLKKKLGWAFGKIFVNAPALGHQRPVKMLFAHFFDGPGTCLLFRPESRVEIEAVF